MTPLMELADLKLGGELEHFVRSRRDAGRPWRLIAIDIRDETGIDITDETLRVWFPKEEQAS